MQEECSPSISKRDVPISGIDIMNLIPHRYPFLLVDRVIDYIPNKELVSIKNVTFNENFFVGHFSDYPIMPGVLIIEAMAQSAGILIQLSNDLTIDNYSLPFFATIEKAKFKKQVIPGDTITFKVTMISNKARSMKTQVIALVEDKIVAEATILLIKVNK